MKTKYDLLLDDIMHMTLEERRQLIRDIECYPWINLSRALLKMKKPDRKIDEDEHGIKGEGK